MKIGFSISFPVFEVVIFPILVFYPLAGQRVELRIGEHLPRGYQVR